MSDRSPPDTEAEAEPTEVALVLPASEFESIDTAVGGLEDDALLVRVESAGHPVPEAEPSASGAIIEAVERIGVELARRLDGLQAQLDRESRAEASREKVVDRLHAELQEYKNDLILKLLRPIFIDLIQLHDDMGKMAEALDDDRPAAMLRDFQLGIEDILYRQGVEPFQVEGDAFDPRRQRAVSTVPTDDPGRGKAIAGRIRKGFAANDKVIRHELVSVFALTKN